MGLTEHFDGVVPREASGPVSSDRSHYQKDWALCQILKLHEQGTEYLVALDIHDDVLVFQPENEPEKIFFYQIKTRDEGVWNLGSLIRRKKGKKGAVLTSILGNLYHNFVLFPLHTQSITLVSNVPFRIAISGDKKAAILSEDQTPFKKLPEKNRKKITAAIRTEHSLSADPVLDELLWFEQADLPLKGHDTYAKGKLTEFFSWVNPSAKYNVPLIYKVLIDEIRRRNDYSKKGLKFQDMRVNKGLGRTTFENMLKEVAPDDSCEKAWDGLALSLQSEGVDFKTIETLRRAWQKVDAQRIDLSNAAFRTLLTLLPDTIELQTTLDETLQNALQTLKSKLTVPFMFDDDFLRAALLMKLRNVL